MSAAKLYAAKFNLGSSAKVFAKGGSDLSKPLSKSRKSVVGVTDSMIAEWKKSDKTTGDMNEALPENGKRIIPGILYTKYKDTPKRLPSKIGPN